MDLFHVLLNIDQFSEEDTIYVQCPWALESEAQVNQVICHLDDHAKTITINHQVFEYFLDVSIVDELMTQFAHQSLCLRDQCQHIIEFAMATRQRK